MSIFPNFTNDHRNRSFKIWPPGGAVLFVYFFVFARFDDVPSRFDDFFLFEMKKLH